MITILNALASVNGTCFDYGSLDGEVLGASHLTCEGDFVTLAAIHCIDRHVPRKG